jgi:hypothetical protein
MSKLLRVDDPNYLLKNKQVYPESQVWQRRSLTGYLYSMLVKSMDLLCSYALFFGDRVKGWYHPSTKTGSRMV